MVSLASLSPVNFYSPCAAGITKEKLRGLNSPSNPTPRAQAGNCSLGTRALSSRYICAIRQTANQLKEFVS